MELNLPAVIAGDCGTGRYEIKTCSRPVFYWAAALSALALSAAVLAEPSEQVPQKRAFAPSRYAVILERVEVTPGQLTVLPGGSLQIVVTAYFSDGTSRNVTRLARFENRAESVVSISSLGKLVAQAPGEATIICSFQGEERSVRIRVPTPEDVPPYRKPRHSSDDDENVVSLWPDRHDAVNRRLAA